MEFNTWHQQRNTRAWTGEDLQAPRDRGRYTSSINERKNEKGKCQEIKDDTEIWVER